MLKLEVLRETTKLACEPVSYHSRMADEFVKAAQVPGGDVDKWIQVGIVKEVADTTLEGRRSFAQDMGYVYSASKGGSRTDKELDYETLSRGTSVSIERLKRVAGVMSEVGVLKRSEPKLSRKVR